METKSFYLKVGNSIPQPPGLRNDFSDTSTQATIAMMLLFANPVVIQLQWETYPTQDCK
jgi:hypothetical protein